MTYAKMAIAAVIMIGLSAGCLLACSETSENMETGDVGQWCYWDQTCKDGLTCTEQNICIDPNAPDDPTDGDGDGFQPSDGDNPDQPESCSGACTIQSEAARSYCIGDNLCICAQNEWQFINCSEMCEREGQRSTGCGLLETVPYQYCQCVSSPSDGDTPDGDEETVDPGLTWVSIPSGSYQQGCVPQDMECNDSEKPRHSVTVAAFKMTATEITQAQYEAVTGSNPSYNGACSTCPVEQVTWYDAKAFCEAVGGRLPSEAEWEYAARAGTTTIWICGDDSSCLDDIACWNQSESCPVGEHDANAFGLYDMSGNVREWVEDCYHSDYNGHPGTGDVWEGGDCSYRVLRDGSYIHRARRVRTSYRGVNFPSDTYVPDGFRCARD